MNLSKKLDNSLIPILLVNFIGTLGFSLVIPFYAPLVLDLKGNAFLIAFFSTIYPLFQFIGAPILGNLSDKYGRKKILLLSQIGTLASWIIFLVGLYLPNDTLLSIDTPILGSFAITLPFVVLVTARMFDGLTGGNIAITQAIVADTSTEETRSKAFGQLGLSSSLGFVVGPALAGLLVSTSLVYKLPVMAAIFISLVATIAIVFFLHESDSDTQEEQQEQKTFWEKLKGTTYNVKLVLLATLIINLAFNIFYATFPLNTFQELEWSSGELGIYFSILSLAMAAVQGPILPLINKHYSEKIMIYAGTVLLSITFLLYSLNTSIGAYIAIISFALGNGIMWPSVLSQLSKNAPKSEQGIVQGLSGSITSIASIAGLLTGGLLYENMGSSVYIISAVVVLTVIIVFRYLKEGGN